MAHELSKVDGRYEMAYFGENLGISAELKSPKVPTSKSGCG